MQWNKVCLFSCDRNALKWIHPRSHGWTTGFPQLDLMNLDAIGIQASCVSEHMGFPLWWTHFQERNVWVITWVYVQREQILPDSLLMCVFKFPLSPERDARSTFPPHPSHYLISPASFPLLGLRHTQESLLTLNAQLSKLWCFLHQRRCVSGFFSSRLRCVLNPSTIFFILLPKMHDFHQKEFREQVPVHRLMRNKSGWPWVSISGGKYGTLEELFVFQAVLRAHGGFCVGDRGMDGGNGI